jgi:hypothetical protein
MLPMVTPEFMQNLKILRLDIFGDVVYLLWEVTGAIPLGIDMFYISNGRIVAQCFAMHAA